MAGERNYSVTVRTGADGAQYVRIREGQPERNSPARLGVLAHFENLNLFKAGVQKALRLVSRVGRG